MYYVSLYICHFLICISPVYENHMLVGVSYLLIYSGDVTSTFLWSVKTTLMLVEVTKVQLSGDVKVQLSGDLETTFWWRC